jgi:hypothetical protein
VSRLHAQLHADVTRFADRITPALVGARASSVHRALARLRFHLAMATRVVYQIVSLDRSVFHLGLGRGANAVARQCTAIRLRLGQAQSRVRRRT